jgi:hypothetical protein
MNTHNERRSRPALLRVMLTMSAICIYQILNHYTTTDALDPGFLVLDNSANERPDWYEYWPIRKYLLNEPLDESAFYGFLSPKFQHKTNLSAAAVHEFVRRETNATDVVLLSPSIHLTAYHLNVFEYGDAVHPGLLQIATKFFAHIGQPGDLHELVTDSRNEVHSNYMIAKPRFWKAWLNITEQLFALAESPTDPFAAELRKPTTYRGEATVPMKIFLMERIATWIIARDPGLVARVREPFAARSRIYKLPGAVVCDALKIAYVSHGRRKEYRDLFNLVSRLRKFLNLQIRLGSFLGFKQIRICLANLSARWTKTD